MKENYSVDNDNRLIIKRNGKGFPVSGIFSVDKDNQLVYLINETPAWRREHSLPSRINFTGSWKLNRNYDLELKLDKTEKQSGGDILAIKGEIISVDRDIFSFTVKTLDRNGLLHAQVLRLSVTWLADEANRLTFIVNKCLPDIVILQGQWQLNRNQQVTYEYEKAELKTKSRVWRVLTFEGFWKISSANKITYILKHSSDSKFDFRAQIETPNIYPQKGLIKYRLGAGLREDKKSGSKIICLYGVWKLNRALALSFQADYGKSGVYANEFGADVSFDRKNTVNFSLKDKSGERMGINVIFTHRFLKHLDAETFLRLQASRKESAVSAGLKIPF